MRDNKAAVFRIVKTPDDECLFAVEDALHVPLGAAVVGNAAEPHDDAVVVHGVKRGVGRDEDVAVDAGKRAVRGDETVAVGVAAETAGDVLGVEAWEAVVPAAKFDQAAVAGEGFEGLRE